MPDRIHGTDFKLHGVVAKLDLDMLRAASRVGASAAHPAAGTPCAVAQSSPLAHGPSCAATSARARSLFWPRSFACRSTSTA